MEADKKVVWYLTTYEILLGWMGLINIYMIFVRCDLCQRAAAGWYRFWFLSSSSFPWNSPISWDMASSRSLSCHWHNFLSQVLSPLIPFDFSFIGGPLQFRVPFSAIATYVHSTSRECNSDICNSKSFQYTLQFKLFALKYCILLLLWLPLWRYGSRYKARRQYSVIVSPLQAINSGEKLNR